MKIRAYEESDLEALRAIHARQGFGYAFPDLGDPLFLTKLVLGGKRAGRELPGAALLRLTAEAYLAARSRCRFATRKMGIPHGIA